MELSTLVRLTTGVTLLACVLAVMGLHTYAAGRAQRRALVDRLALEGPTGTPGRRHHGRPPVAVGLIASMP